jgi:hypothetical protein
MLLSAQTFDFHHSSDAIENFRLSADQENRRGEFHYAFCCAPNSSDRKYYLGCAASHGHEVAKFDLWLFDEEEDEDE